MTLNVPLDGLRAYQLATMPDACDVSRYTETTSWEGVQQDWQTVQTGVPCRVSQTSTTAVERDAEGQLRAVADWQIRLPALTDVTVRDRLLVAGRVFEIRRVDVRSYETVRDCQCVEIL